MFGMLTCALLMNDGSGYMGVGGSAGLTKGHHPTIRLVDEQLSIILPEGKVHVEYVFRNEGAATKAVMAFPEEGYMLPPKSSQRAQKGDSMFGYFKTWVDGKPFTVKRVPGMVAAEITESAGYRHWWVKQVPFAAHQTRRIVNEYQGGLGWGPGWTPERSFSYTLRTGGTWKGGKIGNLKVTIDARGLSGKAPQTWSPEGWKTKEGISTLAKQNWAPTDDISVRWPDGFFDFEVNGRKFPDALYEISPPPAMKINPERLGNEVYVPVPLLKGILGKMVSATTLTNVQKRNSKVALTQVVNALGGKCHWDKDRLIIKL